MSFLRAYFFVLVAVLVFYFEESCAKSVLNSQSDSIPEEIVECNSRGVTRIRNADHNIDIVIDISPSKKGILRQPIWKLDAEELEKNANIAFSDDSAAKLDALLNVITALAANINDNDAAAHILIEALNHFRNSPKVHQAIEALSKTVMVLKKSTLVLENRQANVPMSIFEPEPKPVNPTPEPEPEEMEEPFLQVLVKSLAEALKVDDALVDKILRPFNKESKLDKVIVERLAQIANAGSDPQELPAIIGKAWKELNKDSVHAKILGDLVTLYDKTKSLVN